LTTETARVRIDASLASIFPRLAVVFADPIRLKIVTELFQREMSPSQFFAAYGGGSLSRVDRHFKRLVDQGWLRLVRQETGGNRRGAVENFYRAPRLAVFDNETWAQLPASVRTEFSWRIFSQFAERVKAALEAGTFDSRPERHFTWTPLILDERGRRRVLEIVDRTFESLFEERVDARVRIDRSNESPFRAVVGLAGFDSPRRERNRSGLDLPPPSPLDPDQASEFTTRLARVFSSEINLKIVTELGLREMSASEFAEQFGGGDVPEISRRFRMLAKNGWLLKVKEKTGGKRRGGVQRIYRATRPAIFDTQSWAQVEDAVRETFSWRIFEQLAEQVREAMDAASFDSRVNRHLTWTPFVLDETGWEQVIGTVDAMFYEVLAEEDKARARLAASEEEPVIFTVYIAAFESTEHVPSGDWSPDC
jgi:DNA-binding transcriptional ArsR family regulator